MSNVILGAEHEEYDEGYLALLGLLRCSCKGSVVYDCQQLRNCFNGDTY